MRAAPGKRGHPAIELAAVAKLREERVAASRRERERPPP
jgi:hypothetical protein